MVALISSAKAQKKVVANLKAHRLAQGLTQEGLALRAGVSLASLRKFEQQGVISLTSFFKVAMVLGCLEGLVQGTTPQEAPFASIEEVLNKKEPKKPQRGWRK